MPVWKPGKPGSVGNYFQESFRASARPPARRTKHARTSRIGADRRRWVRWSGGVETALARLLNRRQQRKSVVEQARNEPRRDHGPAPEGRGLDALAGARPSTRFAGARCSGQAARPPETTGRRPTASTTRRTSLRCCAFHAHVPAPEGRGLALALDHPKPPGNGRPPQPRAVPLSVAALFTPTDPHPKVVVSTRSPFDALRWRSPFDALRWRSLLRTSCSGQAAQDKLPDLQFGAESDRCGSNLRG
jgi:hypothetical protein